MMRVKGLTGPQADSVHRIRGLMAPQVAGRLGLSCRCAAANSYVKKLSAVSQMRVEGCVTRQTEKGAVTK